MSLAPCPIGRAARVQHTDPDPCPTMLQPYRGRLVLGIAAHLERVHDVDPAQARAEAERWLKDGCRARG